MEPKIGTLTIERFRAFRHLKIEGLGRVNLITGRNNTGKSSVLEALRILASAASPGVIYDILKLREEDGLMEEKIPPVEEDSFLLSSLFYGFPRFSPDIEPITIEGKGFSDLFLQTTWLPEKEETGIEMPAIRVRSRSVGNTSSLLAWRHIARNDPFRPSLDLAHVLPCVFVSPNVGERTATLGSLWDKLALSDLEKDVVDALRIIDADISAVSMVGGEGVRQSRIAVVRTTRLPHPVPLRSFGDGLNRLFGIILSLVSAKGGLLLIDEFENGMHHTVQADAWRAIFRLAGRLSIQVFATSHSWDAIEAFQKVARESAEEGVLVRLTRKGEDIIPTVFCEDELAIVTRDRIEVR